MLSEKLPDLKENTAIIPGFSMTFSGNEPGADGDPTGEHVCVELTVAPLNFATIRRMLSMDKERGDKPFTREEELERTMWVVERGLARNYRGVPRWLIEQSIDLSNVVELSQKIAGISLLIPKKTEEQETAQPNPSTGKVSTAS